MLPARCLLLKPRQLSAMPTRIYKSAFEYKVATDAEHPLHTTSQLQWSHNRNIDVFCFHDKIVYHVPLYSESPLLGDKNFLSITIPIAKDGSPERVLV